MRKSKFFKLLKLSRERRRALFCAGGVLLATRIGLWILPLATLRRVAERVACWRWLPRRQFSPETLTWGVCAASRVVPKATCLVRAVAMQTLLKWSNHPSQLHVGVARSAEGKFQAHAWVECDNKIVIGGEQSAGYSSLLRLKQE